MRCSSCKAPLLPGATTCSFCGAPQNVRAGQVAHSSSFYANWQRTWSRPRREYWRLWLGLFTGGLYGPIAGRYLFNVDRWHAGFGGEGEPGAPWQNGFAIILLIVVLPVYAGLVLTNIGQVLNVPPQINESVQWQWAGTMIAAARRAAWFGVLAAAVPLLLGVLSFANHARYGALMAAMTGDDPVFRRRFARGRWMRFGALLLCALPIVISLAIGFTLQTSWWESWLHRAALAQLLAFAIAAWAASWLAISPAVRFRQTLKERMQQQGAQP